MTRLKGTCYNVKLVDLWFFIKKSKFHISYLYKSYQLIYLILEDHFFNLIYIYIYIYWTGMELMVEVAGKKALAHDAEG